MHNADLSYEGCNKLNINAWEVGYMDNNCILFIVNVVKSAAQNWMET